MKMSNKDKTVFENLSAMFDGELSSTERNVLLDRLLGDPDLMKCWQRHQLIHDAMHGQLHDQLLKINLQDHVSQILQDEPVHFTENLIKQKLVKQEKIIPESTKIEVCDHSSLMKESWFSHLMTNRLVTGTSVAASVMFATLFTVQHFQNDNDETVASLSQTQTNSFASSPSPTVSLPANLVSTSQVSTSNPVVARYKPVVNKGSVIDPGKKFTWIKADPKLSQQIQEYVREHEANSTISPFNSSLTPKIRAVSFLPE